MKIAIFGLIAASAMGCVAVNDGRLETAVNAAEPITLVRGEEHDVVRGTIETPEGICNGQADVELLPEIYSVTCGDYGFIHSEFEEGRVYPWGDRIGRFSYTLGTHTWSWEATNNDALIVDQTQEEAPGTARYQSLLQQMNVQEADRLWREWRHTALGYAE